MPTQPNTKAPDFKPVDQNELKRLEKILKVQNAEQFDLEPQFRREYNHWVLLMFDPHGDCVINEFNFRDEAAVDEAVRKVKLLIPER